MIAIGGRIGEINTGRQSARCVRNSTKAPRCTYRREPLRQYSTTDTCTERHSAPDGLLAPRRPPASASASQEAARARCTAHAADAFVPNRKKHERKAKGELKNLANSLNKNESGRTPTAAGTQDLPANLAIVIRTPATVPLGVVAQRRLRTAKKRSRQRTDDRRCIAS